MKNLAYHGGHGVASINTRRYYYWSTRWRRLSLVPLTTVICRLDVTDFLQRNNHSQINNHFWSWTLFTSQGNLPFPAASIYEFQTGACQLEAITTTVVWLFTKTVQSQKQNIVESGAVPELYICHQFVSYIGWLSIHDKSLITQASRYPRRSLDARIRPSL